MRQLPFSAIPCCIAGMPEASATDVRTRLEGRLERIEALIERWQRASQMLRSNSWHNAEAWVGLASSDEGDHEAIAQLREYPQMKEPLKLLAHAHARAQTLKAARRHLRRLGGDPHLSGPSGLRELYEHLPFFQARFEAPVATYTAQVAWFLAASLGLLIAGSALMAILVALRSRGVVCTTE